MTRDYKNAPKQRDKINSRSAKKSSPRPARKKPRPTPGWVWMLGGLAVGLLIAALIYIVDRSSDAVATVAPAAEPPPAPAAAPKEAPKPKPAAKPEAAQQESSPRFDFYTLLPEFEVVIPESEIKEEQARMQPKENVAYMIQVGSFRKYGDADSLKAQLAFLGIEADIDPVSSNGEQWLRVRVGPFTDKRELNRVRNRLHSNKFNTILVKVKKE